MSRAIDKLEPFQKTISKAHLTSAGISIDSLDHKPLIAIANSRNEICPGHEPLKQLAEGARKGILEASGEPIEFNMVAMCGGIAQGHSGMRYCLLHREIITDSIEAMVVGEGVFDGMVYMDSCDEIVPRILNAAARIGLPSVIVTAGPCCTQIKPSESEELRQQFLRSEITERQLIGGTLKYYTGPEICPFLGTTSTMGVLYESLGMMLPRGSLTPSNTSMRRFSTKESGHAVMEMVEMQIRPSQIMTQGALKNTIVLLSAIGRSLNALIHLPTLAVELGISLDWDDFSEIATTTPVLCSIVPNGNRTVVDLHCTDRIPAVMKKSGPVISKDVLTMTGGTLGQILERTSQGDRGVIKSMDESVSRADGIQVFCGNLTPQGALVRISATPTEMRRFKGTARILEGEGGCYAAFRAKEIREDDAVIVRYEGSRGDPGMKELHRATEIIKDVPDTAVITGDRLSGVSGNLGIDYLRPEATDGDPIALIRDGSKVTVDLCEDYLHLEVSDEELEARHRKWRAVTRLREKGLLGRYAHLVNTARSGAALNRE